MDGDVYVLGQHCDSIEDARMAVASLYWSTYRRGIPELSLGSDAGWGCMIRTAQMMLAHAWQRFRLSEKRGCDASFTGDLFPKDQQNLPERERNVFLEISWRFADLPEEFSCFSIQRILQTAKDLVDVQPGEWFGPHTICSVLQVMVNEAARTYQWGLRMAMATDGVVCCDQLKELCSEVEGEMSTEQESWKHSLILTVPLRLGVDAVETSKLKVLMAMLELPQCIGFIGGTPRHSLYVIGQQPSTKNLLYLDPHTTQDSLSEEHKMGSDQSPGHIDADNVPLADLPKWYMDSVKAPHPYAMHAKYLDPCLAVGFFIFDEASLQSLKTSLAQIFRDYEEPLLQIYDRTPAYMIPKQNLDKRGPSDQAVEEETKSAPEGHTRKLSVMSANSWDKCDQLDSRDSEDEFVLL